MRTRLADTPTTPLQRWMSDGGLRDGDVAKLTGLSRPQVSRIRRGVLGASVPAAKRLETLTGLRYWKFLRQDDGRNKGRHPVGASPPTPPSRPKHAMDGAAGSKQVMRSQASEVRELRNSGDEVSPLQRNVVSALDRNTLTLEKLIAAVQKLPERLDRAFRSQTKPVRPQVAGKQVGDVFLTVGEVQKFFGGDVKPVSAQTVYRWIRQGRLPPPTKVGKASRWSRRVCELALQAMQKRDL
jgi:predicted DNA-binding transcriptional regulator AlpA